MDLVKKLRQAALGIGLFILVPTGSFEAYNPLKREYCDIQQSKNRLNLENTNKDSYFFLIQDPIYVSRKNHNLA